jgi:hypothetical protein
MTLLKLKNKLKKYRDNIDLKAELKEVKVRQYGRYYDIKNIEEEGGNVILTLTKDIFIFRFFEYLRFEFYWHFVSIEIWVNSIIRKLI